jgi:hypothetical protein
MGRWVAQQRGQQDNQELVRFPIVCRGNLNPPGARFAARGAQFADQIPKSALLVVVLAIDEELETAPPDRVDLCPVRQ